MEALDNYNFKGYNFVIWFFRLLLLIATIIILLVIFLKMNETVYVKEGEIVAVNPQVDYKAPFEAQIVKINVKEGQPVKQGDTLLVMQNIDYLEQQAKTKAEIEYLQKKIQSIGVLQSAVQRKKAAIDQTSAIAAKKYQLDINRLVSDMKTLDQQYNLQQQRLASANEKLAGDSILYKKDMLSKYEYSTTRDANLALKENLTTIQSQLNKQVSEKNLTYNNFTREQNNLLLSKVQLDENAYALVQAKNDYENQLIQAKETLRKLETELNKQNITAGTSGIINYLFNIRQSSNLINKGDLLVSIAPQSVSYYAKVIVPEKDMPYIRAGLSAHLKLDAYHRFEHGMINGRVSYVAERKEADNFYALVELPEASRFRLKSGYTVHGEIVVQRMPLYKYFIKKLFKRFEPA
ncbi:MAG: HlyD family efflux transporter periplasmic adaptor subunit [Flavisolibacter sp.]|nr:HlyD family efflux transporter periplasmic adaptor subunit [Flavisolibacter sp.]